MAIMEGLRQAIKKEFNIRVSINSQQAGKFLKESRNTLIRLTWLNGTLITDAETKDFQNFLLQSSLIESRSTGAFYSWSNSSVGSDRVVSRIDKAFVNQAWLSMYTKVVVEYLAPGISDHSPLKFALMAGNVQGGRPFKFLNIMAEQEDFLLTVDKAWSSIQGRSSLQSIWLKLKAVKRDLKVMKKQKMGIAQDKVEVLRQQITELQTQGDYDSNAEAQLYVKGLLKDLNHWSHVEESILHQKSRINWLQKGDANTKLFFTATKARHGQNRIDLIVADDGRMVKDAGAIREEILDFYKKLLGTRATSLQGVDLNVVREEPRVHEFFANSRMYRRVNCTAVTLLPKIPNATKVKEYRPIACCTVVCKIISKILTNRTKGVIGEVVNEAQSGFIPGRHISDNILLATELIRGYTRKHMSPRCIMKVDIRKAYDSVEWFYLQTLVKEFGFPNVFIGWIMECVTTVSYSVLVNGIPSQPFQARKGLRQGDPLSPFLFALSMEYLSRCLNELKKTPEFNFHPKCERLNITHLMFADDLLMLCRADKSSLEYMVNAFQKFSEASGLSASQEKSNVYFCGVNDDTARELAERIQMKLGELPF
ncbi:uncharacterized protein LOC104899025 [Beta vulgaris subsp. vulgaris]|uniref:uncharacterized protein LOC104899025 n=1 Tax=Beta vulgaris subsp. vulgaris TaxID=3555 RepID=UPI00053F41A7|nr:uncharacterized protein LOC104899025 [Beta vulgaris subsp. vulgaris]